MKSFFKILAAALLLCAFAASCGGDSTESEPEPAPTPSVPEPDDKGDKIVISENTDLSPTISQDGESKIVRFTAKKPWQASVNDTRAAADWLHVSPASGEAGEAELTITAERNETTDDRVGYVKIVSGDSSVSISVTQKQRDALTVSPSKRTLDAPETEFEIEVRANIQFEVEVKADWIEQITTRAMTTTVLKFKAKRNVGEERTGSIVIRSGDQSETITITQEKGDFIVDTAQFHIDASAQSVSAKVRANIDFEVTPQAAWIHYNPTRAMTSYTLGFDIDENTTGKERTGEVTVSSGGKSETITIVQSDVAFEVEFDKTEVSREGGIVTATVKSNMEYAIVLPNGVDWLTCVDTRALTTRTHQFKIEANPAVESRSAIIQFVYQSEKGEATKQVTITQQAADICVDGTLYELDANGGQVTVSVQGNTASASDLKYQITQGAEWIHHTETRAVTAQFTFNIDKNATGNPREGEIEFSLPDKAGTKVRIVQSATAADDIVYFPDANFKANLVANFDINKDGEISVYEASLITEIDCHGRDIQSLEGIVYCTSLTKLDCGGNQLTTLGVSKNTALTFLDCSWSQLTTLDVSKNTALTYLSCGRNPLNSLDVSKNTALELLGCDGSGLTSLDVSKNTALEVLLCTYGHLTNLNISGCSALRQLNCEGNQLTSLDVSGCPALAHFMCFDNQLVALDVSKNTALETLGCERNQLTSLDVSKNTVLGTLMCDGNPIEMLNLGEVNPGLHLDYGGLVSSTKLKVRGTKITDLNVSKNKLQSLDVSECPALRDLDCSDNQLTTLDVSNNTVLTYLSCSKNSLTTLDLSNNTKLERLSCNNNPLTTLDLSGCSALTWLQCFNNQLTTLDVSKNTTLIYLECSDNQLTTLDVSNNTALTYLGCGSNQLTTLDVSKTHLGYSTASYPLDCSPMSTLQTLYLKTGWEIKYINVDRSISYIPEQTEILYKD